MGSRLFCVAHLAPMKTINNSPLSFDSIPEVLGDIVERLAKIDQVLTNFEAPKEDGDVWLSIDELID